MRYTPSDRDLLRQFGMEDADFERLRLEPDHTSSLAQSLDPLEDGALRIATEEEEKALIKQGFHLLRFVTLDDYAFETRRTVKGRPSKGQKAEVSSRVPEPLRRAVKEVLRLQAAEIARLASAVETDDDVDDFNDEVQTFVSMGLRLGYTLGVLAQQGDHWDDVTLS